MLRYKTIIFLIILFMGLNITAQESEYIITVNSVLMTIADDEECTFIEAINTVKQGQSSGATEGECIYQDGQNVILLEGGETDSISDINNASNGLPLIDIEISIQSSNENQAMISRIDDSANFRFFEITDTGQLRLEGIRLENGLSDFGGAILNQGMLLLDNVSFFSNFAIEAGGAIHTTGILEASSVTFDANGIFIERPYISSDHNRLINFAGGAIFNGLEAVVIISDGLFSNNESRLGGGIFNIGTAMIYDSEFHDNSARSGGAIFNYEVLSVYNTYLHNNEGFSYGGAIVTTGNGNAFISDSQIILNVSFGAGGGITSEGTTSIIRTTITGNSASGWGGGINNHGNLFLIETLITENQSMHGGGISTSTPDSIFLDDCCTSVIDNIAEEGANIYEVPDNMFGD